MAFLIITGIKMALQKGKEIHPEKTRSSGSSVSGSR